MMNQPIQSQYVTQPNINNISAPKPQQNIEQQKRFNEEQSLAISFDMAAEYSAISRMQSILSDMVNQMKVEEDPDRKIILENRINTLNNMILQREAKINQMEQTKSQFDYQRG